MTWSYPIPLDPWPQPSRTASVLGGSAVASAGRGVVSIAANDAAASMRMPPISIRPARPQDARQIGAVHVDAWRSAYPGILSDRTLAGMSAAQQAAYYAIMIRREGGVFVAVEGGGGQVVGFGSVGRRGSSLADGEIHTLYVLDDWRDMGIAPPPDAARPSSGCCPTIPVAGSTSASAGARSPPAAPASAAGRCRRPPTPGIRSRSCWRRISPSERRRNPWVQRLRVHTVPCCS